MLSARRRSRDAQEFLRLAYHDRVRADRVDTMKLLIAEDSPRLRQSLGEGLRRSGYAVDLVEDGPTALRYALGGEYDAIVLDLMLPGIDGLTVLRRLREAGRKTNVLILSARDHVADRVLGLDTGADDYLVKPFEFGELTARLSALVRRRYDQRSPLVRLGRVELDLALRRVLVDGEELLLTPSELALLAHLALNRGRVVPIGTLEQHLHRSDAVVTRNAIEVQISALRRKLRAVGEGDLVRTRRGFGYFIDAA